MQMRKIATVAATALLVTSQAHAWTQDTHKRIAIDAIEYMRQNPQTTHYAQLEAWAQKAGITIEQLEQVVGQGAYDVDSFTDTYICGAITGDCEYAPVWSLAAPIVRYTSFWHFQMHSAGPDPHGNTFGGYDYHRTTTWGAIDDLAASWLWDDYLDDGPGGMRGVFGDSSKYNSYGVTEANYRLGSYSNSSMYSDYQTMPFQPIDHLGQYWWQQFLSTPSPQTLGYVLHTTDLLQPHHTWGTLDENHMGWEGWVRDNYDTGNLNDFSLVSAALKDGTFSYSCDSGMLNDIRALLTQGGTYSYGVGGSVLSTTDSTERTRVAKLVIPHATALAVLVLDCAAQRVSQQ